MHFSDMHFLRPTPRSSMLVCLCIVSALGAPVFSGCGRTTGAPIVAATPTWTLGPSPTSAPTKTPQPLGDLCTAPAAGKPPTVATVGDLSFDAVTSLEMYPALKLPDGIALKPYVVNNLPQKNGIASTWPLANVRLYAFTVCNTSATNSHAITGVTVKIDAFTPYSYPLNVTRVCATEYSRQGMGGGGCGGGMASPPLAVAATLGSSAPGTTTQATPNPTYGSAPLPLTLAPGYGAWTWVTITPPSTPGTYAYRVGVALDGAAPVYPSPATTPILQAPVAHEWDGDACLTSSMQSQIPAATNPPTLYICPKM